MFKRILILCFVFLFSCQQSGQPVVIQPDKMREVYLDVLHARLASSERDTVKMKIDEVLQAHAVSDSLFLASIRYYEAHPEAWLLILNAVIDTLETKKQPLKPAKPNPDAPSPLQPQKIK